MLAGYCAIIPKLCENLANACVKSSKDKSTIKTKTKTVLADKKENCKDLVGQTWHNDIPYIPYIPWHNVCPGS